MAAAWSGRRAACHPLQSLRGVPEDLEALEGAFFAVDGEGEARACAVALAEHAGGNVGVIPLGSQGGLPRSCRGREPGRHRTAAHDRELEPDLGHRRRRAEARDGRPRLAERAERWRAQSHRRPRPGPLCAGMARPSRATWRRSAACMRSTWSSTNRSSGGCSASQRSEASTRRRWPPFGPR